MLHELCQRAHLRCGQLALLLLSIAPGSLQLRPDFHQMLLLGSLCIATTQSNQIPDHVRQLAWPNCKLPALWTCFSMSLKYKVLLRSQRRI